MAHTPQYPSQYKILVSIFKTNPRISPKDRNAIKGALRRAFARSELHHSIVNAAIVPHSDPSRPKVKKWAKCNVCGVLDAKSYMVVDHIEPIIKIESHFEDMSVDEVINRLWCKESGLQAICDECHNDKSEREREQRKPYKKPRMKKKS